MVNAQRCLVHFACHSPSRLHEVGHLDDRSVAEDVGRAGAQHWVFVETAAKAELYVQFGHV